MRNILFFLLISLTLSTQAQEKNPYATSLDQKLADFYKDYAENDYGNYDSIIEALKYVDGQVVTFPDHVYCERLRNMNDMSPFDFECNDATLSTIRFFAEKRRGFTTVVLGRSKLYFDMYEAKLAEHGLPKELKYLSVIESGLRPQVKSRAGALGLWQFMYSTGKMYGLDQNSYIDERMDPMLATDAACRYLKALHGIYNDWCLALAAYNAGPGNVNKAIRRSGDKRTYWEVRPFLPKETQGYVPNFIAAAYLMTYHAEHNIVPANAPLHVAETDTMCLTQGIRMERISELTGWEINDIKALNPIYKGTYIPRTDPPQCITGPIPIIGKLVGMEAELYATVEPEVVETPNNQTENNNANTTPPPVSNEGYHIVRSGETLGSIATRYGTSVTKVMDMNGLRSTNIYVGQRLKVPGSGNADAVEQSTLQNTEDPVVKPAPKPEPQTQKKYYTVRRGETFSTIARKHGKSISQLKQLNPGINIDRIREGQRIRVR